MPSILFVTLLGLATGSFLNVVVLRREKDERIDGRSHCMHCKHTLAWYELVPVVSYILLAGRCRACKRHISIQYPLVELLTAAVFAAVYVRVSALHVFTLEAPSVFGTILLVCAWFVWAMLVAITVYDLRTKLIPDLFSVLFACGALFHTVLQWINANSSFQELGMVLLAGGVFFLPFYGLWKISDGRWIGLGDGKLAIGIGWLLGFGQGLSAIVFGFWIGAFVSLAIMGFQWLAHNVGALKSTKVPTLGLKSEVPFGPFLVLGTAVVYFTGLTLSSLMF